MEVDSPPDHFGGFFFDIRFNSPVIVHGEGGVGGGSAENLREFSGVEDRIFNDVKYLLRPFLQRDRR